MPGIAVKHPRPKIVISKCLEFDACRYDGTRIENDFVKKLKDYVDFLPICPEQEIGLGVPRDPIEIIKVENEIKLVQPASERDLTDSMKQFCERFITELGDEVDGFILKSKSPSCGLAEPAPPPAPDQGIEAPKESHVGLFASALAKRYPNLVLESEYSLFHVRFRDHFLTRVFTFARLRAVRNAASLAELSQFHSKNQFLLMGYGKKFLQIQGQILANPQNKPAPEVISDYEKNLRNIFMRPQGMTPIAYVFMHGVGHLRTKLTSHESLHFRDMLEKYKQRKLALNALKSHFKSWIVKYDDRFLAQQTFFEPYPSQLM